MSLRLSRMRLTALLACLGVAPLIVACGEEAGESVQTPDPAGFPKADGESLAEIQQDLEPSELVVLPAGNVFREGTNRLGLGVFTVENVAVDDAEIALYAAAGNKPAAGPFPAALDSLETAAAFRSQTSAGDPDAPTAVYSAEIELGSSGTWRVMAVVRETDGSVGWVNVTDAIVDEFPEIPDLGENVPVVHTPTVDDVADVSEIDTRIPPSTMHEEDLADVLGKEPVVLLFATPAYCASRVCGPVADVAEQVNEERSDDAAFIHMEIYEDNDPGKPVRSQVEAFGLPTEPWVFVIDEQGRVSTRIEGAFSVRELNEAVDTVAR